VDLTVVAQKVAIALGLGLLVGLQRERVQSPLAGIRTFAIITVLGSVCALLGLTFGGWIVGLGALAVAAMLVVGNLVQGKAEEVEPGVTTEMAALLMYGVGAYLVVGHAAVAIAIGGGAALLLHWKVPMHEFVARIGETDLKAIMRFVLVALVIYPVLPDEGYGPYGVLNPQQIWLMVVLIVGIGLGGYVAYKLFGQRPGAVLAGLLGGLISSTATTVSYARRTRAGHDSTAAAALVIVVASAVAFARVLTEMAVVAPSTFWRTAPPLAVMLAWTGAVAAGTYFLTRPKKAERRGWSPGLSRPSAGQPAQAGTPTNPGNPTTPHAEPDASGEESAPPAQANPAEMKPALIFAGLYALVLLGVAAARDYFGSGGLYAVAVGSGLHDLDAITLSTARFVERGQVEAGLGWRLILAASLANLVLKGAVVAVLGEHRLLKGIAAPFAVALLGGAALLLLWPVAGSDRSPRSDPGADNSRALAGGNRSAGGRKETLWSRPNDAVDCQNGRGPARRAEGLAGGVRGGADWAADGSCCLLPTGRGTVTAGLPQAPSLCESLVSSCASKKVERRASEPETPDCCSSRHLPWTVSSARHAADGSNGRLQAEGSLVGVCGPALTLDPGCPRIGCNGTTRPTGRIDQRYRGCDRIASEPASSPPVGMPGFFMRLEFPEGNGLEPFALGLHLILGIPQSAHPKKPVC
jgi:uncharacterized membrane protein (DUF4010 family)